MDDATDDQTRLFEPQFGQHSHSYGRSPKYPIWSQSKAKLVERYLFGFLQVTKHGVYIDGFAGAQDSTRPETWTARRIVELQPPWLNSFYLFELNPSKVRELEVLRLENPERHIIVKAGDFNSRVTELLVEELIPKKAATFCLLDQRTAECQWETVVRLADYKRDTPYKVELFYFLAQLWLDRALGGARDDNSEYEAWWGSRDWTLLRTMDGRERAEVMTSRFRTELGYAYARPWPIFELRGGKGRIAYYMIHASDHHRAEGLMLNAYEEVVAPPPMEELKLFEYDGI